MHYSSQTTLRILAVLAERKASVPEVADAVGIDIRSARRILIQLRDDRYVVQSERRPHRRYRFTDAGRALGLSMLASADPDDDEAAEVRDAAVRLRETTERILADQAAVAVNEALDVIGASATIEVRVRLRRFSLRRDA